MNATEAKADSRYTPKDGRNEDHVNGDIDRMVVVCAVESKLEEVRGVGRRIPVTSFADRPDA